MNSALTYYKRWSIFAFILFLVLVGLQILWLNKAIDLQQKEQSLQLKQLLPDLAIAINGIGHDYFHGKEPRLDELPLEKVEQTVLSYLEENGIESSTFYAIYQDTIDGFYHSNTKDFEEELHASNIKSCMSCIISFSFVKDQPERQEGESDDAYSERLFAASSFQYYSPVQNLIDKGEKTIWLSLYQPPSYQGAIRSMLSLFGWSMVLLIVLLGIFYYLLKALAAHKELTRVKDDFFNSMTHEFKTPLSSIRLASRVLRQTNDVEKKESYYDLIEKESKQLEHQIDKLLELSLLDHQELELEYSSILAQDIIKASIRRLQPLIEEKEARLQLDLPKEDLILKGDFYHLTNSLTNLIENSLKYSQKGVQITLSISPKGEKTQWLIRDNGPGIAREFQAQIFDRFYRATSGNQYKGQGFGIGLSYVKNIIEAHQGNIALNTAYTEGSEFIINL